MSTVPPRVVHHPSMPWTASPAPGVWRRRLEHEGPPEAGRVTSVVRFEPETRFSEHPHPDGEEIFVLEGTFSDHTGDHGPGSYVYPTDGVFTAGSYDLTRFEAGTEDDDVVFTFEVGTTIRGSYR